MKTTEQPVSDALVDAYIKRNLAAAESTPAGLTPGAGRACKPGRHVPGKRLRNWHRFGNHGLSLRAFASAIADGKLGGFGASASETAKRWLASK